ncbi:MAG: nitroreductase family protein [Candidatus Mcinerneyibacterium aminivorans]|uniref:Nitroreductase family protein n=1 Tax=Candidatus Mcinerneyibacterium aminivorans TaxID=2703815 RepID=A0A5D0MGK1_9BACT|nr:MAG: nitroreductase family protein [Candidatus Mcinerneyibacterium aminivorans]
MKEIFARRSIRKYKKQKISEKMIQKILQSGMAAPSAGNEQPWHFIVITSNELKQEIAKVHPYSDMLPDAPAAILVCGDTKKTNHGEFWIQDCSAATENMLLMITSLGLGGVWVGVYPRKKRVQGIKELLDLPDNIIPFSIIPFGYPDDTKKPHDRYLKERVHYNQW